MSTESKPILNSAEAAAIAWPGLPAQVGRRRLYRWVREGIVPGTVTLRPGRALYFKAGPLREWLCLNGHATAEMNE